MHSRYANHEGIDWRIKAALQRVFSSLPLVGEQVNYLCQRLLGSFPTSKARFFDFATTDLLHIQHLERRSSVPLDRAVFYEFGGGWELRGPAIFWAMGVEHQTVVDIRHLLRPHLFEHTLRTLMSLESELGLKRVPRDSRPELQRYGIRYLAPCDSTHVPLSDGSVEVVVSTNTLQHIPAAVLPKVMEECRRILRPGGLISFYVNYCDQYSYTDRRITEQNFLRYSDFAWRFFNPPLHYQNRLRHSDYVKLFRASLFETVEEVTTQGPELTANSVHPSFLRYGLSDLAIRDGYFLLRKPLLQP